MNYPLSHAIMVVEDYILAQTGKTVRIKLDLNNQTEVALFEKACINALDWFENTVLNFNLS